MDKCKGAGWGYVVLKLKFQGAGGGDEAIGGVELRCKSIAQCWNVSDTRVSFIRLVHLFRNCRIIWGLHVGSCVIPIQPGGATGPFFFVGPRLMVLVQKFDLFLFL